MAPAVRIEPIARYRVLVAKIDETTLAAMQHRANDGLRSLNARSGYVPREALGSTGRLPGGDGNTGRSKRRRARPGDSMGVMSALMPILVVLLALIAAGSIAYIAWELSSEEFHRSFGDADDEARPDPDD